MGILQDVENFITGGSSAAAETALWVDQNGQQWAGVVQADGSFHPLEPMFKPKPGVLPGHAYQMGAAPDFAIGADLGVKTAGGPGNTVEAPAPVALPSPTGTGAAPAPVAPGDYWTPSTVIGGVVTVASVGLSAYHGFKRNGDSAGWAVVWGLLGGAIPVITPLVAVAQGFGKLSDDARLGRLEGAFVKRPDLLQAMHAEMAKT